MNDSDFSRGFEMLDQTRERGYKTQRAIVWIGIGIGVLCWMFS